MLLGLVTGARRVRGVAPIVFAGLLVFGLAPFAGLHLTQWLSGSRAGSDWVLSSAGLETGFVLIALPAGLLAWQRLRRLARDYEAKRFSDAQLLARTWWLLIVATEAVELISVYPGIGNVALILATSAAAYLAFAPLLAVALCRAYAASARPPARMLLLLRVFGNTARTEALFDRTASRWQMFGAVTMIAAPDVVARTVDPGDFLRFASGRIGCRLRQLAGRPRAAAGHARCPSRPGRTLSRQRLLLPRQHLAGHGRRADRARRRHPHGRARVRRRASGLRVRARAARRPRRPGARSS